MSYPFDDWLAIWLDKVDTIISDALGGESDMSCAVAGHFIGVRGKRLRAALSIMAASATGDVNDDTAKLAAGIEMVHLATLVHDDIVDSATLRRGTPTPNAKWGSDWAILTGDYVFAKAFTLLAEIRNTEVISSLSKAVTRMCEGEWDQLKDRFRQDLATDRYEARISGKTAAFMGGCCESGVLLANGDGAMADRLYEYGHALGMAFQIADDILDYQGNTTRMGKPVGEDMASGVYTLPLIFAIEECGSSLVDLLDKAIEGESSFSQVIETVISSNGLLRSRSLAKVYAHKAAETIEFLPDSPAKEGMKRLAHYAYDREC